MENHTFTVESGGAGTRLDVYLIARLPKAPSRTYLQKLIRDDKVHVNGAARKSHYKVEPGDFIEVEIARPRKLELKAENLSLNIVFEDERLIVVDKPAGMVVHPAPGNYSGTLINALLYHAKKLSYSAQGRPGIVHRLDKNTSGLLVIAKDEVSHAFLAKQFGKRKADKRYLAVVEGVVQLDNGVVEHPIGRHPRDRKRMSVRFSESKSALTRYKVLERFDNGTFLEIKIETGRTHQIRVHMAYIGHPVMGDETYGSGRTRSLIGRQALHAAEISFIHPETKVPVRFSAPMPADIVKLLEKLKKASGSK